MIDLPPVVVDIIPNNSAIPQLPLYNPMPNMTENAYNMMIKCQSMLLKIENEKLLLTAERARYEKSKKEQKEKINTTKNESKIRSFAQAFCTKVEPNKKWTEFLEEVEIIAYQTTVAGPDAKLRGTFELKAQNADLPDGGKKKLDKYAASVCYGGIVLKYKRDGAKLGLKLDQITTKIDKNESELKSKF